MPNVSSLDWRALDDIVTVHGPTPDKDKVTLHSIFKDEIFFCAAFFDHYRKIGVEQFIIFDDGSTDGTREFLLSQGDCIVLTSSHTYEDRVCWFPAGGRQVAGRFDTFLRSAIPRYFRKNKFSIHVDADEFLLLPASLSSLRELVEFLESRAVQAVVASLVDFYPESYSALCEKKEFHCSRELFRAHPYFDGAPLVRVSPRGVPIPIRASKLRNEIVASGLSLEGALYKKLIERWRGVASPTKISYKTPVVWHDDEKYYVNNHGVSCRASREFLLTVAHFTFTCNSLGKADRVVSARRRYGRFRRYDKVAKALRAGVEKRRSLITPDSECLDDDVGKLSRFGLMCGFAV